MPYRGRSSPCGGRGKKNRGVNPLAPGSRCGDGGQPLEVGPPFHFGDLAALRRLARENGTAAQRRPPHTHTMSPFHVMPNEHAAARAAALDELRQALAGIRCVAALLVPDLAAPRERQLLGAILRAVARGEAAWKRLGR